MQFLTLWTSLNYALLRFNHSISIQYRLTACTWAQKSTADDWLTSLRRLLCAFLERGLKMGSKEIQDVSDSNGKGENYQQALTVLNEAVDIVRSPSMSSCQSITTATVGSHRRVVSKTKHSKTKTEARSTQNSKTKHPNLENEAPYLQNKAPKTLENEAPKTRKRRPLNLENEAP